MSDYFHLAELVPPAIYTRFGEQRAWNFVNRRAYKNLIKLSKYLGKPLIINNYHSGGERVEWFANPREPLLFGHLTTCHCQCLRHHLCRPHAPGDAGDHSGEVPALQHWWTGDCPQLDPHRLALQSRPGADGFPSDLSGNHKKGAAAPFLASPITQS